MTATKEQQVVVVSEFEVGRVDGVNADASIRIIVSEGCAMPVKGNLTQPETLKKFAHVSFRKFVHLVQIVVNG